MSFEREIEYEWMKGNMYLKEESQGTSELFSNQQSSETSWQS